MKPKTCYSCKRPFDEHTKKDSKNCLDNIFKEYHEESEPKSTTCSFCGKLYSDHSSNDADVCLKKFLMPSM